MTTQPVIFVLDDNNEVIESLRWLLESVSYQVKAFSSPLSFLNSCEPTIHGCIVSDVRMPEMTGLELQETLIQKNILLPIIFITAYAEVATAVRAMKYGAVDFLTKPVNNQLLLEAINKALQIDRKRKKLQERQSKSAGLIKTLTPREHEILLLVANGASNKSIAQQLGISPKTVELHRSHLMHKLKLKTTADLVRLVLTQEALLEV